MSVAKAIEPTVAAPQGLPTMGMKQIYDDLLRQAMNVARELKLRDDVVYSVSKGAMPSAGGPLAAHYLGRKRFTNDFLAFYDRDAADAPVQQNQEYSASYLRFLRERSRLTRCPQNADVLFVDRFFSPARDADEVSWAPYVNAVLPMQATLDAQLQQIRSKGHRRKLQSALKQGFSWRKTHSSADFDLFYDVMYAPFVQDRFRGGASIVPRAEMFREYSKRGFLLFVEENGVPISGALMYTSRQRPESLAYWKYGLAHGKDLPPALFGERNAMTEAMVLQYTVNEKYRELDFGLTRAMPSDGIFTHKKRLGCDFRKPSGSPEFAVHINPASLTRLLTRFPLVVQQQGKMHAWLAHEGEMTARGVEEFKEKIRACAFASLKSIRIFVRDTKDSLPLLAKAVEDVQRDVGCTVLIEPLG